MPTTYGKEYKDFDMDFGKHPSHGDLLTVTKTTAINRSINNIIRTQVGERLFQPDINGGLNALLFAPFGSLTETRIAKAIGHALSRYETRANVQDVTVKAEESENAYLIHVTYIPDNDVQETTLEVYLEIA